MADLRQTFEEKLKNLLGNWTAFIAVGSFLLYLLGYLATRFYLTVLGVGTDLSLVDERYFFAGAKFLVYLFSTLPILAVFALILGLIGLILTRLFKWAKKKRARRAEENQRFTRLKGWLSSPNQIAIFGCVISVILIQVLMRKCFHFSNLLLTETLPDVDFGLGELLLDCEDLRRYFFFMALVGGTIMPATLWVLARSRPSQTFVSRLSTNVLGLLVIVQFLFLPINYGVYIQDRLLPRVADLGDQVALSPGQKAWLIWEGSHTFTYLVEDGPVPSPSPTPTATPAPTPTPCASSRKPGAAAGDTTKLNSMSPAASPTQTVGAISAAPSPNATPTPGPASTATAGMDGSSTTATQPAPLGRRLVSVPQKDLKRTTILEYDQIFRHIFCRQDCKHEN